jgi:hypothetical protein
MVLGERLAYVAGFVWTIGGMPRKQVAAIDLNSGAPTPLDLDSGGGVVTTLMLSGNTLYVGGGFASLNGAARASLASVDAETGQITSWDPHPVNWDVVYPQIRAMSLKDSSLWVGGSFSALGGQPRICLAAVDTVTGSARTWDPGADGLVWSLATCGQTIYAGGGFSRIAGLPCAGVAAIRDALPIAPQDRDSRAVRLGPISPNPVRADAVAWITLKSRADVTVSVFDIQGRCIATILNRQALPAGVHQLLIHPRQWPAGVCFVRLQTDHGNAVRKMLLVK